MAEDFAIGKALVIPQSVLNNINKLDEKINLIASDSEKMATHFSSAMTRMGGNAGELLAKLQNINNVINNIGSINAKGIDNVSKGIGNTATEAERAANSVTKVATALNKMGSSSYDDSSRKSYIEKYKMYERMFDQIERNEKRAIQAAERESKAVEEAKKREYEAQAKLESKLRRSNYQSYVTSTEGSLRTADKANTYAQRAQAIKNLEAAIKKLRTTDANYQKDLQRLSDAHKRLSAEQKKVEANFRSIKGTQSKLMNTSDQLARKLALIFSVSQIEGYVNKLVRVRGEFELQNTALASILQNKDKADKLFGQITDLAVQSPFTLKELVTYTKSLSAYSVEYEKLYDTTKMLADVSAGLGVDMQRLILAFGQVKAANFLRGTETRQFTEAGINMLGELAKYYSELEGRIVSVNEVQDRQFKRMISFQDVEQVFKRLTSAGGMFYNMQERQAETIAGMMSNLQDRIDLMLNSIGKSNEGTIKGVIELLQSLLANYELVINMLKTAGAAFLLYKANVLAAKESLILFAIDQGVITKEIPKSLSMLQLLNVGFKKLSISIKTAGNALKTFALSNIPVLAFAAIATAIYEVIHWNDEYNEQISSINKKNIENAANLNKIVEAYEKIAKSARKAVDSQKDFSYSDETYKELYAQLSKLSESLKDRGYTMPIQIEFVTPQNIDEAFKGGKDILQLANDFSVEFGKAMASQTTATEGWFNVFGDNLSTDLQELSDAYGNVAGGFKANLDLIENEVITISDKLTGAAKGYYEELRAGQKDEESSTEWTLRRLDLLYKINQEVGVNLQEGRYKSMITNERTLIQLYRQRLDISNKEKEVQYELGKVVDELIKKYGSIENLKKVINKNPIVIKTEIDRYFEKEELDAQTKRFASHWLANKLQIPIEFTTPKALPTFFNDFRDTVKTLDVQGIFDKQLDSMSNLEELEGSLQKKYSENEKYLQTLNRSNTERLDLTKQIEEEQKKLTSYDADVVNAAKLKIQNLENQKKIIDKTIESEKERLRIENQSIVNIANAFNLSYKNEKKSTGENSELKRLKERIALIKKAGDEYEKLRKYYSEDEAKKRIVDAFGAAFDKVGVSIDMDFDIDGIIKAIENLTNKAGEAGEKEMKEAVAPLKAERDINVQVKGLEEIQKQLDEVFAGYELSVELKNLGLDENIIGQLFNIDTFTLDDVKKNLDSVKPQLEKIGENGVDVFKKTEEKIADMQQKELEERLKKYADYLKKSVSERMSIEMEAQKKISEVQSTSQFTDTQKKDITDRIKKERDKELDSLSWKEFQESDMYIQLFEELEYVSTSAIISMKNKLTELRDSLKNLSPEQLKEINNQIKKLEDIEIQRNPFKFLFSDDIKEKSKAWQELGSTLNEVANAATDIASSLENVFGSMSDKTADAVESFSEIASGLGNTASGVGRIMAGDYIGGGIQALTGIFSTIGSIFNIGDKKKEREIQRQLELVDDLQRAYEKLEKAIDDAYSIDTYKDANDQAIANLESQNASLQAAIAAEQDKKKTDDDRIKEWRQQIEDNNEAIEELLKEQFSQVTGGILDDILSAANDFTDAWLESFKEVGDGMDGLEENFQEMLTNMLKQQASMLITNTFLENWKKQLEKYINADDLELTTDEAKKWVDSVESSLPALNEALENYFKAMQDAGLDLSGEGGDTMTGLEKGITSITEDTAEVLASITESIRYFTSDSNTVLHNIYNLMINPPVENPFLSELKVQSEQLRLLYGLFNGIIKNVSGSGKAMSVRIV